MRIVMVFIGVAVALWAISGDVAGAPPCEPSHVSSRGIPTMHAAAFDFIQTKLDEPTDVEFLDTPLDDVVEFIKTLTQMSICIDHRALEEAAIAADAPITARHHMISLRSALKHILRPLELTYTIRDEVLVITTRSSPGVYSDMRVYPVCDLVSDDSDAAVKDYESLMEIIYSTVSPSDWVDSGGPGLMKPAPSARSLVIATSEEIHEQIEGLFATLRKARGE